MIIVNGAVLNEVEYAYTPMSYFIIGSNNAFAPIRRQAIIWTNAAIVSIRPYEQIEWSK